jgi:hypothetical protein
LATIPLHQHAYWLRFMLRTVSKENPFINFHIAHHSLVTYLCLQFQLKKEESEMGDVVFINPQIKTILIIDDYIYEQFHGFLPNEDPDEWRIFGFGLDEEFSRRNFKKCIKLT